jgi:hypothetical protein
MNAMKQASRVFLFGFALALGGTGVARAQTATGSIQFDVQIRAAAGVDEPVRQADFYLLRKSFSDIEAEAKSLVPPIDMNAFIDKLEVSKELKVWMKANKCVHFSGEDFLNKIKPDDMIGVKEFYDAYLDRMQGDQTVVFPQPKYKPTDKEKFPEKYEAELKDYKKQVKTFYIANPTSNQGLDLGLEDIDPGHKWDNLVAKNKGALDREMTLLAEGKYLAGRAQTDLDGHGHFQRVPVGTYWLSSLNVDSLAGEERDRWDAPVVVTPSHQTYLLLSNINAVQAASSTP